jgi:predicted GH43/DUF377 family glycosyl hydrolase
MKWEKTGEIFNFENSPFKERFVSHAQSPQTVCYDNYVRIYFSTRKIDEFEKFVSHVQYIDYDIDSMKIINYSKNEIISHGNLGCFDEHGIFPFSPVKVDDQIYAYTSGWTRRVSVDVDSGIGLTVSKDEGNTFTRLGDGPILSASLNEPFLVSDPFVRNFNGLFYMFYIFGTKWSNTIVPERVYKIAYATSNDGINWEKANRLIIPDVLDENECQALPTVIKIDDKYHMYFCYRNMIGFRTDINKGYRIGYAYSSDLTNWIRDDSAAGISLSKDGWDSEMMCYPHIFRHNDVVYLLYNGNKFGKFGFGLAKLIDNN